MHYKAKFLTIEGCEGVGKTTNANLLESILQDAGISYIRTREPGGTPLAESLRELILNQRSELVHPLTELLMVFAARAQHVQAVILPALMADKWVLCDRFTDASFAYQGAGRGLDLGIVEQLEEMVHAQLQPDLTLYLDMPVDQALARIQDRELDRIEKEKRYFFETVRNAYLARAERYARFRVINADQQLQDVQSDIREVMASYLKSVLSE